jgi:hypothetical protein
VIVTSAVDVDAFWGMMCGALERANEHTGAAEALLAKGRTFQREERGAARGATPTGAL